MTDSILPSGTIPRDNDGTPFAVLASKKADGSWSYGQLDAVVELEIDGTTVSQRGYNVSGTGSDVAVVSPSSGKKLKIYRLTFTVQADVVGEVLLKKGTTILSRIYNPKVGGQYGFSLGLNYELTAINEGVKLNAPSGTFNVDVTFEETD